MELYHKFEVMHFGTPSASDDVVTREVAEAYAEQLRKSGATCEVNGHVFPVSSVHVMYDDYKATQGVVIVTFAEPPQMPMTFEELRKELIALTELHKRVDETNDTITGLFAPLLGITGPTSDDLQKAKDTLQKKVPGFYVWYSTRDKSYALYPRELPKDVKE